MIFMSQCSLGNNVKWLHLCLDSASFSTERAKDSVSMEERDVRHNEGDQRGEGQHQ